jgi:hypothetical protein
MANEPRLDPEQKRRLLIQKLSNIRAEIVRVSATWQAAGQDSSAMAEPVVQLQEVLAILEQPDESAGAADVRRAPPSA